MTVTVAPHDPAWQEKFEREAAVIRRALGSAIVAVHHIGSTAISGIHAKPIIDVLVEATSLSAIDMAAERLVAEGFEAMGEYGIAGRRYFRRNDAAGRRRCHVHAFVVGHGAARRHLVFRDHLQQNPDTAAAYSALKRDLAKRYAGDSKRYAKGKEGFIEDAIRAATLLMNSKKSCRRDRQ